MFTKGMCRHFLTASKTKCGAGINLRQHVGGPDEGWTIRLPCTPTLREANAEWSDLPIVECELYSAIIYEEPEVN